MAAEENPWTSRLGILVMTHVAGTISIVSVLAMAPVITHDLSLSAAQFGFFVTTYYGAQSVISIPAGGLVDRVGVGKSLVICHVIMIVGALLFSQAGSFEAALVALAVMGMGYSISNPATARGVLEWFPQERRATAMGIKQVGVPLGGMLGAANGALVTTVAWGDIMAGVAVLIFMNGVVCLKLVRLPATGVHQKGQRLLANIREVMKDQNINRLTFINGCYNFGQTNFFAFLTLFLREVAQASQPMASLGIGIAQAASAIGRIGWGVVSDTIFNGRRKGLTVGMGAASVVGLVAMVMVGPGHGVLLGLGLALVLGVSIASFAPLLQTLSVESSEPRLAGSTLGYTIFGTQFGGMIGPPIFGAIVDASGGYGAGWLVTAAVMVTGTLILAFGFKERNR